MSSETLGLLVLTAGTVARVWAGNYVRRLYQGNIMSNGYVASEVVLTVGMWTMFGATVAVLFLGNVPRLGAQVGGAICAAGSVLMSLPWLLFVHFSRRNAARAWRAGRPLPKATPAEDVESWARRHPERRSHP